MTILSLQQVSKRFGITPVINELSLDVARGERHAIIGPNGAGKSTLFHLISGKYPVSDGRILFNGQPIHNRPPYEIARMGLTRSFQVTNLFHRLSVFENIRCALLWSMGYRYAFWRLLGRERELNEKARQTLEQLGLADLSNYPAGELAYADQRALELGLAIASGAEMILLDEPVAGMSLSEAGRAVALIRKVTEGRTLLMVEHDMNIVFELADRITVLVYGQVIASGTPATIRENRAVQEAYLGEEAGNA